MGCASYSSATQGWRTSRFLRAAARLAAAVYGSTRAEIALEPIYFDLDPAGNPFFVVSTDAQPAAISMPPDLLQWPPTIINDIPIHTLSPLALVHIRAGAAETGAFGTPRSPEGARQAQLVEAFLAGVDPRETHAHGHAPWGPAVAAAAPCAGAQGMSKATRARSDRRGSPPRRGAANRSRIALGLDAAALGESVVFLGYEPFL